MKIRRGWDGGFYAVFYDNEAAYKWHWLFWKVLRRPSACYGQYENAYYLFG